MINAVKFGGFGAMFWGGIAVGFKSSLIHVEGSMDAELYIEMLEQLVYPELVTAFPDMDFIW